MLLEVYYRRGGELVSEAMKRVGDRVEKELITSSGQQQENCTLSRHGRQQTKGGGYDRREGVLVSTGHPAGWRKRGVIGTASGSGIARAAAAAAGRRVAGVASA